MGQAKRRKDLGLYPEKTGKTSLAAESVWRPIRGSVGMVGMGGNPYLMAALAAMAGGGIMMGGPRAGKTAIMNAIRSTENALIQGSSPDPRVPRGLVASMEEGRT